ncbi:TPA: hypothetical protein ACNV18_000830 [Pseudomonas putida]
MYQIQHEIQKESETLLKAILEYEAAHKHETDFVDTIYEYFHWKIEELFDYIEKHRDNGISTFHTIAILKDFWALGDLESMNQSNLNVVDILLPSNICQMIQEIPNDEYRFFEEQNGTAFYKLHLAEPDDAPHREYPFDVLTGRSVKK